MFSVPPKKSFLLRFLPMAGTCAALFLFALGADVFAHGGRTQEKELLSAALSRSITECYALEGFYPPDLAYLCDHYGFTYNSTRFLIDYHYIGDNLRPDVTILEKEP